MIKNAVKGIKSIFTSKKKDKSTIHPVSFTMDDGLVGRVQDFLLENHITQDDFINEAILNRLTEYEKEEVLPPSFVIKAAISAEDHAALNSRNNTATNKQIRFAKGLLESNNRVHDNKRSSLTRYECTSIINRYYHDKNDSKYLSVINNCTYELSHFLESIDRLVSTKGVALRQELIEIYGIQATDSFRDIILKDETIGYQYTTLFRGGIDTSKLPKNLSRGNNKCYIPEMVRAL